MGVNPPFKFDDYKPRHAAYHLVSEFNLYREQPGRSAAVAFFLPRLFILPAVKKGSN